VKNVVNIWAILIITVIYFILGALWYSKLLFGKIWAKAMNFNIDELRMKPTYFIGAAIAAFLTTLALAVILEFFSEVEAFTGVVLGLIVGVGFVITIGFYDVIYEDKNIKAYAVDAGYHLVALLIAGLILGVWKL
jgi:hypothetical protein